VSHRVTQPDCLLSREVTARLVALIESDRLSVAAAARTVGIEVERAGVLVRQYAVEQEWAEAEVAERLDQIQALCPREDWWSYSQRQLEEIFAGEWVPNRIVREPVEEWCERTGSSTANLAEKVGLDAGRLRRALGMAACPASSTGGPRRQKTVTVDIASAIVRAIGIPPREVPGL
jgi:hypothetical protein